MSKVNIEDLVYKKPDLYFGLNLLGKVRYGADPVGNDDGEEEELPMNPNDPDNPIFTAPGDGSGNTGAGGQ